MAQDYHIYIHSETSGNGGGNKTTPFSAKKETPFSTKINQGISKAKNIMNSNLVSTGAAKLVKAVPVVAVAVAVAKITDKVLTIGFAHQEEYTGRYANNVNYNNFKTAIYDVMHPFKTLKADLHRKFQNDKANKQIAQQNKLVGDSIMKDFNLGV